MRDNRDARTEDAVGSRLLVPGRVYEVTPTEPECRAIREQLIDVRPGKALWFLGLVLGVHDSAWPPRIAVLDEIGAQRNEAIDVERSARRVGDHAARHDLQSEAATGVHPG